MVSSNSVHDRDRKWRGLSQKERKKVFGQIKGPAFSPQCSPSSGAEGGIAGIASQKPRLTLFASPTGMLPGSRPQVPRRRWGGGEATKGFWSWTSLLSPEGGGKDNLSGCPGQVLRVLGVRRHGISHLFTP